MRIEGDTAYISIRGIIAKPDAEKDEVGCVDYIEDAVAQGVENAELYINTKGGDVFYANDIVNALKKFKGTVNAELGALCASAGTYIASAVNGEVGMPANGHYMWHKPSGGVEGTYDEVIAGAKLIKNCENNYVAVYVKRTGKTAEEITAMWANDCWMSAQEAKAMGFIDTIIGEADIDAQIVEMFASIKNAPKVVATTAPKTPPKETINPKKEMDIKVLAKAAGLDDTASEVQVIAAISELKKDNTAKDDKIKDLEATIKTTTENQVKTLVEAAIKDNKIAEADRKVWEDLAHKDLAGATTAIAKMHPYVSASSQINNGGKVEDDKYKGWTWKDYQEKDPKALEVLSKTDPDKVTALKEAHAKILRG